MTTLDIAQPGDVLTAIDRGHAEWLPAAAPPLLGDVTLYVDSVGGDDGNDGSQAAPFETLQRALDERAKYGVIKSNVTFAIQLIGTGPYELTALYDSHCEFGGMFVIRGDLAAKQVHYSGTFTGNASTNTIGTAPGLGVDTYAGRFIRVLTGGIAGTIAQIASHTDTSITLIHGGSWQGTAGTVNGDTFEIFSPTTQLTGAADATRNCTGEIVGSESGMEFLASHVFFHLLRVGSMSGTRMGLCVVEFMPAAPSTSALLTARGGSDTQVTIDCGAYEDINRISGGAIPVEYNSGNGVYFGNGATTSGAISYGSCWIRGIIGGDVSCGLTVGSSSPTPGYMHLRGSRLGRVITVHQGILSQSAGSRARCEWRGGIVATRGQIQLNHTLILASSTSHAIALSDIATLDQLAGSMAGGSTFVGGYGIDAQGHAQIVLRGAPAVTGQAAGADLRVQGGTAQANSTLGSAGTAVKSTVSNACIFRAT